MERFHLGSGEELPLLERCEKTPGEKKRESKDLASKRNQWRGKGENAYRGALRGGKTTMIQVTERRQDFKKADGEEKGGEPLYDFIEKRGAGMPKVACGANRRKVVGGEGRRFTQVTRKSSFFSEISALNLWPL